MRLYISNGRIFVSTDHFAHGSAARAFFNGIVHAASDGHSHAEKGDANNEKDENRPDDCEFNGRRTSLIVTQVSLELSHG
jgi:hypothetical protein